MQTKRITFNQYPLLLRQIDKPPPFLEIAGADIIEEDYKFLCIVGARNFTSYGADATKYLISGLKNYKIVIVSGLAIGIDSIAHQSALENKMRTIAIPGSGLDESVIYPHSHISLAKKIVETSNTLISPFENTQPSALWTFPTRNRLMAGISHATLIIEGKQGSGTLLTAKHAIEFNRDVMIVPGSIFGETSYGPHLLYKDGAIPVTNSEDILQILGFEVGRPREDDTKKKSKQKLSQKLDLQSFDLFKDERFDNLSPNERLIVEILKTKPLNAEDLINQSSIGAKDFNILISQLELKNIITKQGPEFRIKYS